MTDEVKKVNNPRRTALYVPGDKPRALEKAPGLGADVLILDLEDAVAHERKTEAREGARAASEAWRKSDSETLIRLNGTMTQHYDNDIIIAKKVQFDGVVIPKVERVEDLRSTRHALDRAGYNGPIWAVIETPLGVVNLKELCESADRFQLVGLIAGTNDLCANLDCECCNSRSVVEPHLINIVLHARAFGLCALDGVYNNFQDEEGLLRETKEALRFGFDGKTLIHPSQIEPVRQAYLPDPNALSQARDLVAAFENPINAGKGAISFNGRMVEAMHYHQALRLIARAKTS